MLEFLLPPSGAAAAGVGRRSLILLNRPLERTLVGHFWRTAGVTVCADGAANRLFDLLAADERQQYVPQHIVGDLDSIRPEVVAYYKVQGTTVHHVHDQDSHDLEKCVMLLQQGGGRIDAEVGRIRVPAAAAATVGSEASEQEHHISIIGALGGRLDHEMANINTLFKFQHAQPSLHLILVGTVSAVQLLPAGCTTLSISAWEGPTCGLLPIGGVCEEVTTTGLEWDVTKARLGFGGLISSSNLCKEGQAVTVQCSQPLVWTVQFQVPAVTLTR